MASTDVIVPGLREALEPYMDLLSPYVAGEMSPEDFQDLFVERFLSGKYEDVSRPVFAVLDGFFAEVDSYVDDPQLRDPGDRDLGPDELMAEARRLLRRAGLRP